MESNQVERGDKSKPGTEKKLWKLSVIMFLFTILLIILIGLMIVESRKCKYSVEEADLYGKQITFFGDKDVFIPLTEEDMDKHCEMMFEGINFIRRFARACLPPFPQQTFSIFTYDKSQVIRDRCKRSEIRKKFLEYAKCWSPKEKLHETSLCIDKQIIQLEYIYHNLSPDYQMAALCCTFHHKHQCIKDSIEKICDEPNVDYVMESISGASKDVLLFACGQFTSTEECDRHFNASVWQSIRDIVNTDDENLLSAKHKYKSVLAPIVSIITHFEM